MVNIFKARPKNKEEITLENVLLKGNLKNLLDKTCNELPITDGIILITIQGKHIGFDSVGFDEAEAIWALNKAIQQILNKGISLND